MPEQTVPQGKQIKSKRNIGKNCTARVYSKESLAMAGCSNLTDMQICVLMYMPVRTLLHQILSDPQARGWISMLDDVQAELWMKADNLEAQKEEPSGTSLTSFPD